MHSHEIKITAVAYDVIQTEWKISDAMIKAGASNALTRQNGTLRRHNVCIIK